MIVQRERDTSLKMCLHSKKWLSGILLTVLGLLFLGMASLTTPAVALAADPDTLEITGDGVTTPLTLTRAQLEAMPQYQHVYSAINTWPTKKWYVGKGVKLRDLFDKAGMREDAKLIRITSRDGYVVNLTVQELLRDKRYYFPELKGVVAKDGDGHLPGSPAKAQEVEPMLALVSVEGSNNPDYMNDLNSLLLMLGQRAVTEQNGNLFSKYVNKIEVLTTEPEKWDSPQANPESGIIPAGSMVALSNAHMDDDKIYYTTDGSTPTINSPMYNWIAKRWWSSRADDLGKINHPIGPINENTTIKAITIGPGKYNSDVVTFTYQVEGADPADETEITTPSDPSLNDVAGHWALENINQLVNLGCISGYPDGSFKPNSTITRAEYATVLVKAFKLQNNGGKIFNDTVAHWAKDSIAAAAANGLVDGYADGTFGPDDLITREQMAVMIVRAAKLAPAAEEPQFADSGDISVWAREAIVTATQNGIMKGYSDNTVKPAGSATRAEAVTVIINALNK
ncbi:MAG: S-layer homology domain-containing protein [Desulfotomaculaceae bacterium]|nr:S-layer homology domain-containing protein [Desulfotomaculaceae bacterium]